ncbi:T9SS type A sorting domain-containing protein [candidate division KSB1 bacterium]|nr:T9SS type A sorting domain-containing protein [candidate division KSB1 bacterium]RQW06675.1 MAG: T9SS C-terminal target domain-containing protein [candidate division KSB1 bacterium]
MIKKGLCILLLIFAVAIPAFAQSKGTIVFVSYQIDTKIDPATGDYPDMPHVFALQDEGYEVIIFYDDSLTTASEATLDTLYDADLIIMGRSTPSIPYQTDKLIWNEITTPILNLELWNCRGSRLNWFNTETMVSIADEGTLYNAIIDVPDDPVFEGWDTSAPIPWVMSPFDAVGVKEAGNGKVLARLETDSTVVFVRFEPDVEFYDGSIDMPAGHRTVIGNGRDNSGAAPFNYYNFVAESEQIFLAEVARMVALGSGSAVRDREHGAAPRTCRLLQNYPNPFNPTTTIPFTLTEKSHVRLALYDVSGAEAVKIADGEYPAGQHEVVLHAGHLPAGVYLYKIETDKFAGVKKLALVK